MYVKDTIAAIATPPGEGGIGIVRVSGPLASDVARRIFRRSRDGGFSSHRFYYGSILDGATGAEVDEGMAVLMLAPRSYTREDVLELHCHGGTVVTSRVLAAALAAGARPAEPGEFTRRAFLNGRIDLLQAEAVMDIITSRTASALAVAERQRRGELSTIIRGIRERLAHLVAFVEAHLDFAEDEVGRPAEGELSAPAAAAAATLDRLLATFDEGKALREGVRVLIAGLPNVGKSSLLNALLRENRALVTDIPGTTRDAIEESMNIRGLPVRIIDTAGIRHTTDPVEKLGVDLALEKVEEADLVLFVSEAGRGLLPEEERLLELLANKKKLLLLNKSDISGEDRGGEWVSISVRDGSGLEELQDRIFRLCTGHGSGEASDHGVLNRERHRDALSRCSAALDRYAGGVAARVDLELLAADLREALQAVGEVTGEATADEILDLIFSRFCIGK
ncbi:MAG TPA: tRNA uridine-5-carboxymethylaminomethyl(34) synthesis GTPase MnmE [Verrucomicrobiae bacterium]|nr:tRNA uridine-5-carboxymethylaminomethyl(34) synthesis GTPase MnmE [Verrucomicrobiae bacterium]